MPDLYSPPLTAFTLQNDCPPALTPPTPAPPNFCWETPPTTQLALSPAAENLRFLPTCCCSEACSDHPVSGKHHTPVTLPRVLYGTGTPPTSARTCSQVHHQVPRWSSSRAEEEPLCPVRSVPGSRAPLPGQCGLPPSPALPADQSCSASRACGGPCVTSLQGPTAAAGGGGRQ